MTIAIVLLIVLFVAVIATQNKAKYTKNDKQSIKPIQANAYKATQFMTDNEIEFFNRLTQAFPECYIFPQVAMSGLVAPKTTDFKQQNAIKNTYNRARVDFVLYKDKKVVAVVELDDKTHKGQEEKDQKRDDILAQAGYKTFRFISTNKPSVEELRTKITKNILITK